jgi:hypothetical protein
VGVLFATHRRVAVRTPAGTAGPEFCTCGDVWPCRREELAVRILDAAFTAGPYRSSSASLGGTIGAGR